MPLGWGQAENESARVNDCICLLSESFSSGTKSTSIRLQFDKDRENGLIFNFQEVFKKFRVIDPFKKLQMLWEYVGLCVNGEVLVPVGFTDVGEPRTTLISVTYCYITYSCEHLWKETHTVPEFQNTTQASAEIPNPLWMSAAKLLCRNRLQQNCKRHKRFVLRISAEALTPRQPGITATPSMVSTCL